MDLKQDQQVLKFPLYSNLCAKMYYLHNPKMLLRKSHFFSLILYW